MIGSLTFSSSAMSSINNFACVPTSMNYLDLKFSFLFRFSWTRLWTGFNTWTTSVTSNNDFLLPKCCIKSVRRELNPSEACELTTLLIETSANNFHICGLKRWQMIDMAGPTHVQKPLQFACSILPFWYFVWILFA